MKSVDFYFRNPSDPAYREGILQTNDDLENTLQQVRMTLLTKKGEVLGEPDFGFGMEQYLFEFDSIPLSLINKDANEQIEEYVLYSRKYKVRAEAGYVTGIDDENRTSLVMDVLIDGSTKAFSTLFDV